MATQRLPHSIFVLACAWSATTASAQVMEWVPVSSTGPSTIDGNTIILPEGGVQVQFDLFIAGWGAAFGGDGAVLGAYAATLEGSSLLGVNANPLNPGVDLSTPEPVPCQSDGDCPTGFCGSFEPGFCDDNQPAFQFTKACLDDPTVPCATGGQCPGTPVCIPNLDFVLSGCDPALAVVLPANRNFVWIAACQSSHIPDPGVPRMAGSLRIDVPVSAEGSYSIRLNPDPLVSLFGIGGIEVAVAVVPGVIQLPADCNINGVPDDEEIATGQADDCDGNGVPDECDSGDCNDNGRPDHCDILIGVSRDCNANGIPDECEPADCNSNGTLDSCDIENMTSEDCNNDGVPDECQLVANDCNTNDVPDDCDISGGASTDCNLNGVPDSCDPDNDCDTNGVQDICDVAAGAPDCNFNEVPDECEPDEDCNTNGVRDICDIGGFTALDCNGNSVPDSCDLSAGSSPDTNGNNVPDECDVVAPLIPSSPHDQRKNRFISFSPLITDGIPVAYRVDLLDRLCAVTGKKCTADTDCTVCDGGSEQGATCSTRSDCPGANCAVTGEACLENSPPISIGWVGDPVEVPEDADARIPPGLFTSLVVRDEPTARLWPEEVVHVGDCEIAPAQSYALSASSLGIVSDPLVIGTVPAPQGKFWGDVVGAPLDTNSDGMADIWSPPNGLVNVHDVLAWLRFKSGLVAPHITVLEMGGEVPNFIANVSDLGFILKAFQGQTYPPPPFSTKVCVGGNDGALCTDDSTCAGGTCTGWDPLLCP